jgi:methylated-DNA-[protein]-cysteine S-methyltransferase
MEYTVFQTNFGWMAIVGSEHGLVSICLPLDSAQEALESQGELIEYAAFAPKRFKDLIKNMKAYFSGQKVSFQDKIDFSVATFFQAKVWQEARFITYGETRSYKWLAEKVGTPRAGRAVGQVLGKNKLPIIIPCHRVLKSNGQLGGFGGGLEMKRRLLNLEAGNNSH